MYWFVGSTEIQSGPFPPVAVNGDPLRGFRFPVIGSTANPEIVFEELFVTYR
jgi:hypothetical protein